MSKLQLFPMVGMVINPIVGFVYPLSGLPIEGVFFALYHGKSPSNYHLGSRSFGSMPVITWRMGPHLGFFHFFMKARRHLEKDRKGYFT